MKGILVHVLRSTPGDCTNGGVSAKYDSFVLVGSGMPEVFSPSDKTPVLFLERGPYNSWRAVPDSSPEQFHKVGPMFGGNYIDTSDSRFTKVVGGPVKVFDRFETQRQYDSNWL